MSIAQSDGRHRVRRKPGALASAVLPTPWLKLVLLRDLR
jgi:hypothetical protein